MSSLIGNLINGAKSLAAQGKGVELAGRNLANVNNPAYARQRVVLGDRGTVMTSTGPQSMGVEALGVQAIRDQFLDRQVAREISQSSMLAAQQSQLAKTEANLGEQIDRSLDSAFVSDGGASSTGIGTAINDFFNAFDNLSARPSDTGAKQILLQKADVLAGKFNVTDQRLASQQSDITDQINSDVTTVNGLLDQISKLNGDIQKFEILRPDSALDLRDQRQAKLEELAQYMDFTTRPVPDGHGQIQVVATDSTGADVLLVDKTSVLGGVSFDGTQFSGGSPSTSLDLQGGSLKGNLDTRDGAIQQLRDDLKRAAGQMTLAVNAAYNPGNASTDFFQASPGASKLLVLEPGLTADTLWAGSTGDAGANDLALAVAGIANRTFSTGSGDLLSGTLSGFYAKTVSGLGQTLSGIDSKVADQDAVEAMVRTQRDAVSGVSMDEELADLMKYQRAYQASARVINVLDELLDQVVNGLAR